MVVLHAQFGDTGDTEVSGAQGSSDHHHQLLNELLQVVY